MRVNLLVIATNKYLQYLESLLDSADQFFLRDQNVAFSVFTDQIETSEAMLAAKTYVDRVNFYEIEHRPFPYPTLFRFHFFNRFACRIADAADYYFYIDVDSVIAQPILADDVVSPRTAVQHCGYVGVRGAYEKNRRSTCYVPRGDQGVYFGGGFWGFSREEFWKFTRTAVRMIDLDLSRGITPRWHDESVLNRYLVTNPPHKILTPSYHWPQNHAAIHQQWKDKGKSYECVIMLLDKNHAAVRAS